MRRHHLFEIEDQPWCPVLLRDLVTDYLQLLIDLIHPYDAVAPRLTWALKRSGSCQVLDLASGAGGPWPRLQRVLERLGQSVSVRLSDKYPNLSAAAHLNTRNEGTCHYLRTPVDATGVPPALTGFRTIFSSFHHFRPKQAVAVLKDAVQRSEGIGVFEALERRPRTLLLACLNPLLVLLLTPWIRPFRPSRLLWTYLLPAVPLIVWFDGLVSCLRAYTPDELRRLAQRVDAAAYTWEVGTAYASLLPVTYLLGYPAEAGERSSPVSD